MADITKKDGSIILSSLDMYIATYIERANKLIVVINESKLSTKDRDKVYKHLLNDTKNGLSHRELILVSGYVDNDGESGGGIEWNLSASKNISEKDINGQALNGFLLVEFDVKSSKSWHH